METYQKAGLARGRFTRIMIELAHHLPFSLSGVVAAILVMALLTFIAQISGTEDRLAGPSGELFHIIHPFHVLFSAVTTTAVFWKHDNHNVVKAMAIGFFGSVFICGISDIIVPFIGGVVLGQPMSFHMCLVEEPGLVFPFAIVGVLAGLMVTASVERSTQYSHGMHVFLSSAASLLYLISFGWTGWMHDITGVFFVTMVAVVFPCCLSDIVFPMVCTHRYCRHSVVEVAE